MKFPDPMVNRERAEIIRRIKNASAFSWLVFQLLMLVLVGSHISAWRAATIGAGVGAGAGLFFSFVQWQSLRHYVHEAGWWIPATTAGTTLGGVAGSLTNYYAARGAESYAAVWQASGLLSGVLTGLILASPQWLVVRNWWHRALDWYLPVVLGTALSSSIAWLAQLGIMMGMVALLGTGTWAVAVLAGIVAGGVAGGGVYAYFMARALRKVLPATDQVPD